MESDCFAWEYKGKHVNLDKAYAQLLMYYGSLDNPPLLIVSDIETIRIHTHFTNTVRDTDDPRPSTTCCSRTSWICCARRSRNPKRCVRMKPPRRSRKRPRPSSPRSRNCLRGYDDPPPAVAHFLIRLLFCLFAEDVGILPSKLFTRLVTRPKQNAAAFRDQLRQLFAAMMKGGYFGVDTILHVDGGLFNDDAVLLMDSDILADAGRGQQAGLGSD